MVNKPKVSIITVVYNNKDNLIKTIDSIRRLNYSNFEYIVIDGGSTDSTLEVIQNNLDVINKWISESDKGIYDAMNKGMKLASGEYYWFINAGDEIFDNNVLNEIFEKESNADVYYGDTELVDREGTSYGKRKLKRPPPELSWKNMIDGMIITHQSLIVKKDVSVDYDLKYIYCSDIDWIIRVLKNSKHIFNTSRILCKFQLGGYSRKNTIKSLLERFKILNNYFNPIHVVLNHIKLGLKFLWHIIRYRRIL
ncbi:MAG: glycosyltransferase [Ignavibacteria bacterium]|nr:glycosyltransferase [Ignavibacteria bacterium]